MARTKRICLASVLICGVAAAQTPSVPYLLRIDHSNFEGHSCALLNSSGAFHLEISDGDDVKVSEGAIGIGELTKLKADLNSTALVNLSQPHIEEPLIRTRHDELQVTVFRAETWQDLFFQSSDSQQPFRRWLQPLVHWLDTLPRVPHRELSEDEGRNRCLPVGVIALKKRGEALSETLTARTTMHVLYGGPTPQPQPPPQPVVSESVTPLLLLHSFERKSESAHESCALIGENGTYRFEDRTQKTGKPVTTKIITGQIGTSELRQLHQLLDDPALAMIKHHEPPGHGDVSMMKDKLDVTVSRPAGVQHFILSSSHNRSEFPSFYRGDADAAAAQPLLKFLTKHLENNPAGILDPSKRNGCAEAP